MSLPLDAASTLSVSTVVSDSDPKLSIPEVVDEKAVDPFLVRFAPGDERNPKNWSRLRRWYITAASGVLILSATYSSSAPSPALPTMALKFGFSSEVATLVISIFVAGYCVGPILWAPLSEQYGRRPVFILSFFFYTCFEVGSALSKNTASILVFRLLAGIFAAAPLSNSSAIVADIWGPKERGAAQAVAALAPFAGPGVAPFIGGYIIQSGASWRWVLWVPAIFAGFCWGLVILTIPETFEPVLLVGMAKEMRKSTGNQSYYAKLETISMTLSQRAEAILGRPFKILFQEPILIALTVYMSFVYGCLYLLFEAYPIVYTKGHNLQPGPAGLVYLPIAIGGFLAAIAFVIFIDKDYVKKVEEFAPEPVPPEYRLRVAMMAGPMVAVSFFWFAWTSFPSVPIWAPLASAVLLGFGICWIFLALFNYIVDVYLFQAASALAASTVVRSAVGAGFPMFATQMYNKLDPEWASTLVAFIALGLAPIPFVFAKYGPQIRSKSKFAPSIPSLKLAV